MDGIFPAAVCTLQNQNHHWDGGGVGGCCLRRHWRHLPLHSVDAGPRGNEGQDAGDEVHQHAGWVTLVAPCLPQLIQTCSQNENYSCLMVVNPALYTHNHMPDSGDAHSIHTQLQPVLL